MQRAYELRIFGAFVVLLTIYLFIARTMLAPVEYYGTIEQPRFMDPWIARAETIISGQLLYRDVSTMTPPLINALLIPPTLVAGWFGYQNPWATLAFMLYFALFNLFTAYLLLYMAEQRAEGYRAALAFLFNPLTFGNAVLRRQDEAILTFFFALSLLFILRRKTWSAAITIGLTLLVKLSGALLIPIAWLRTRDWRYVFGPPIVFILVFAPFLILASRSAFFWDVTQRDTQHPFQLDGISLGALWYRASGGEPPLALPWAFAVVLVVGSLLALALIAWKPRGLFEDLSLLTGVVLLLSPKLHCGYLSLLALTLAPLAAKYRIGVLYIIFGLLALVADFYKWPVEDFAVAFELMLVSALALALALAWVRRSGTPSPPADEQSQSI